jgi:hypothetical protein
MSERARALAVRGTLASDATLSPLSRDSSSDTLNKLNDPGSPEVPVPEARDGFFDYRDEKTLRSVGCKQIGLAVH